MSHYARQKTIDSVRMREPRVYNYTRMLLHVCVFSGRERGGGERAYEDLEPITGLWV